MMDMLKDLAYDAADAATIILCLAIVYGALWCVYGGGSW